MLAQARQTIRALTATLVAVMLVMVCPCGPCGPATAVAMAPASMDAQESKSTGCCPGDADNGSEENADHQCAHCDADATLQASAEHAAYAIAAQPLPPTVLLPTAGQRSAHWAASAQPPVVRRALGPPPYTHVTPTPTRLALLATLRC